MQGTFLFLGTGGSAGIPLIGCQCAVCRSSSSHNKRLRSSGLIRAKNKNFIIDVGPDFRAQALQHHIDRLDGALLTHAHADHVAGIDDLRAYYFLYQTKIPCVLSQETFDELKLRYHYILQPVAEGKSVSAQIDFRILPQDFGDFILEEMPFEYLSYYQSGIKVIGYRIGNFAYVSDIREYSHQVIEKLQGVEILVLSALRHVPSKMHFSIEEAIAFARSVSAKKTYLTHIAHDLDHDETNRILPPDVRMSYDGLEIPILIREKQK